MAASGNFSRRQFAGFALGALVLPALRAAPNGAFNLQAIYGRMIACDKWRTETLLGYSVERLYRLRLGDAAQPAELRVRLEYSYPDRKTFQILSRRNCGYIEGRVFRQVLAAETETAREDVRDRTSILPCNYDFQMLGMAQVAGRESYLFQMRPKRRQRFLVEGKVWVDARDGAVTRLDGDVASSSFWVRSFHMVQNYRRVGDYWMLGSIRNDAAVRLLGTASMEVENSDYQLRCGTPAEESRLNNSADSRP